MTYYRIVQKQRTYCRAGAMQIITHHAVAECAEDGTPIAIATKFLNSRNEAARKLLIILALNAVANHPAQEHPNREPFLITPHPATKD